MKNKLTRNRLDSIENEQKVSCESDGHSVDKETTRSGWWRRWTCDICHRTTPISTRYFTISSRKVNMIRPIVRPLHSYTTLAVSTNSGTQKYSLQPSVKLWTNARRFNPIKLTIAGFSNSLNLRCDKADIRSQEGQCLQVQPYFATSWKCLQTEFPLETMYNWYNKCYACNFRANIWRQAILFHMSEKL